MDALSFNPLPSGAAAATNIATEAALPDGGPAGIDFAALLALGMNPSPQDISAPQVRDETETATAINADGQQRPVPAAELLVSLPQQLPSAETVVPSVAPDTVAADIAPTQAHTAQVAPAASRVGADAAAPGVARAPAAVVADEAANIADAVVAQAHPTRSAAEDQNPDQPVKVAPDPQQEVALETSRAPASEAALRAAPAIHTAQAHPVESRAPVPQPSALLEVQAPVSEPGFAQALSRQVVWMVDKDAQVAELRINPPELGPVEVRLTLTQDSAVAEFVSPHAEVRAALESAIVRLREAMAEAGIQLGEASVSAESFRDRADAQGRDQRGGYRDVSFAAHDAVPSSGGAATIARGLVDVFA